ncbi:MAG TPA: hypothetical protein VGP61_05615, partial [Gemmatimonadales bacterium]|nr:hypothetical protein [Gemmatimonadales bacterium]
MRALPLAAALWCLLVAARVRADAFSDFRIPRHSWFSLSGDFFGYANPSSGHYVFGQSKSGFLSGSLSGTGSWVLDSDKRRDLISLSLRTRAGSTH